MAKTISNITATATYDESEWPLYVVRMPARQLSDEAFRVHLEDMRRPYRRLERFVELVVMGDHPTLSAIHRRLAAEAMEADKARYPDLLCAKAIVAPSSIEQGVVTAVGWMAKPAYPFLSFENEREARGWLLQELRRYSLALAAAHE